MRASWMVHALVDETVDLTAAFVAHYLDLGADLVHLYLDRVRPDVDALLASQPKVRLTTCDATYWAARGNGKRPPLLADRQLAALREVYAGLEQDWLFYCDADEYLVPPLDFGTYLACQPATVPFLRIEVVERVQRRDHPAETVFGGIGRRVLIGRNDDVVRIYGEDAARMMRQGMLGHSIGKSVIRRGRPLFPAVHFPFPEPMVHPRDWAKFLKTRRWQTWAPGAWLVHFDGVTPLHYLLKLLGKADETRSMTPDEYQASPPRLGPSRLSQIEAVDAARADPERLAAIQRVLWLSPEAEAALRAIDGIAELGVDPVPAVRRFFPAEGFDYSAARFDAGLRALHADLIARNGFAL